MTQQLALALSYDEARRLTDEVKADAAVLWTKLLRLYEGDAHKVLGYSSWAAYFEKEFRQGAQRAYRLLDAALVLESLTSQLPIGNSGVYALPTNEAQARELAPLRDEPEVMREVWQEAVERSNGQPTAAFVREVREVRLGVHFSSATDDWSTPQDLFDQLDDEFGFDLDVCATAENTKCGAFFDRGLDGLSQPWAGNCWMNPPYGDAIGKWVAKAAEAGQAGATVVCLLPARTDTNWWWDYARYGEVRFLKGRLKFGGAESSAPFPSCVVIFGRPASVRWWER